MALTIGKDGYLREWDAEKDDPNRYEVERAGKLLVVARSGSGAARLYPCHVCDSHSRGDMTAVLAGHFYCDGCWSGLRRQGKIVDGRLVDG